jgi:hypothetical protein
MIQENTTKRGSNITESKKRKVSNNFRGSNRIKYFIELIKTYKIVTTGNDKLSIGDTNCAKFFSELIGRENSGN